ncbi:fungal class II heme-containing peroxidase [Ancistrocladus abbreviatus]
MKKQLGLICSYPLFSVLLYFSVVAVIGAAGTSGDNPFSPKSYLIRYWNNKFYKVPRPEFLVSKASPLTAAEAASFAKLACQNQLSAHLDSFCKSAKLFCFPDVAPSLEKHDANVNFATYDEQNFTNYGTDRVGGVDSFSNYSPGENVPLETFRRYSRDSRGHDDKFTAYAPDSNVISQTFNTYGGGATGGTGEFTHYADDVNVPGLKFTSYSAKGNGREQSFETYSENANAGDQGFASYGKDGNGLKNEFVSYGDDTNVVGSTFSSYSEAGDGSGDNFTSYGTNGNGPENNFKNYGEGGKGNGREQSFKKYSENANAADQGFASYGKNGNGLNNEFLRYGDNSNVIGSSFSSYSEGGNGGGDNFTSYGFNGNVPENNFKNYGEGGNSISGSFSSYRDQSNVGDDSFQSYAKKSDSANVSFANYGQSFNEGTDKFTGYGKGASGQSVGFKIYGVNNTFKDYAQKGITFASYRNDSSETQAALASSSHGSAKAVNRWVEPGKFFREKMLKSGVVMPMPDIRDKMPQRSFLPRSIASKLPFSSSRIADLKQTFHAFDNSSMERILNDALQECERAPSRGETKRCVGSAEDMIDFAASVLGNSVEARTTQNVEGSRKNVMIGKVRGINGGKVTQSVSCHQSLYPYLLYYCHSVPKVRVYEADILDPNSKAKINHGVAICHLDTTAWSPTHGAFLALGSGPGKIEVCHWIFENDMTWTIAD